MVTQLGEMGYYNRETQEFIPMSELQPRSGTEWAKLLGTMDQPEEPTPTSPEIEELGHQIEVAQETFAKTRQATGAVETAMAKCQKDMRPAGPILIGNDPAQRRQEAEDAEAVRREAGLKKELEAALEEQGLAQRNVNTLLRQQDGLIRRARQEAKEQQRQQKLAEEQEASARAKPGRLKRLGIKA